MRRLLTLTLLIISPLLLAADGETYQTPEAYLEEVFGEPPASQTLWLTGDLGDEVKAILDHPPRRLRERYWYKEGRSVWIMEEIGKERPITMAFLVENRQLTNTRVLIYRESRGWEIRLPAFTRQFVGATLTGDQKLDRHIDGITGATLSVRAMKKLARVALRLHEEIISQSQPDLISAKKP